MPLTTGLTIPKSPLIAPMMTDAMMTIIPRTRSVAKVLSHLWPTRTRLLPMLSVTPLFSIRRTWSARENIIASMIPGTIRAMKPRKTMIPTIMLSAQIERSFETANLMDVPKLAYPFVICSEASFDCAALGNRREYDTHNEDHADEQEKRYKPCGEPAGELLRRGIERKSRKDERLPRQCSDDLDDHSHYRKENEILGEVSSVHLEGFEITSPRPSSRLIPCSGCIVISAHPVMARNGTRYKSGITSHQPSFSLRVLTELIPSARCIFWARSLRPRRSQTASCMSKGGTRIVYPPQRTV